MRAWSLLLSCLSVFISLCAIVWICHQPSPPPAPLPPDEIVFIPERMRDRTPAMICSGKVWVEVEGMTPDPILCAPPYPIAQLACPSTGTSMFFHPRCNEWFRCEEGNLSLLCGEKKPRVGL